VLSSNVDHLHLGDAADLERSIADKFGRPSIQFARFLLGAMSD